MDPPWKLYYKTRNAINMAKLHFDTIGKIKVIIKYGFVNLVFSIFSPISNAIE